MKYLLYIITFFLYSTGYSQNSSSICMQFRIKLINLDNHKSIHNSIIKREELRYLTYELSMYNCGDEDIEYYKYWSCLGDYNEAVFNMPLKLNGAIHVELYTKNKEGKFANHYYYKAIAIALFDDVASLKIVRPHSEIFDSDFFKYFKYLPVGEYEAHFYYKAGINAKISLSDEGFLQNLHRESFLNSGCQGLVNHHATIGSYFQPAINVIHFTVIN